MFTREEYENLINNSPLFEIDKESSPALYKTEKYKFITILTEYYLKFIFNKESYVRNDNESAPVIKNKIFREYSLTFMETATECIKYFDRKKGKFLHLFNSALKRDLHIAKAKEEVEKKRQGIRLSNETNKKICQIIAFADSKGLDIYDLTIQQKISKALNINCDKLKELIYINDNATAVASTVTNDDGDEDELYDLQASKEKTVEDSLVDEAGFLEHIEVIDKIFISHRKVLKEKLSMLLTVEIIKVCNEDLGMAKAVLQNKEIYSEDIFEYYTKNGKLPTRLEIGKMLGMEAKDNSIETKLSKVLSDFMYEIKRIYNKEELL